MIFQGQLLAVQPFILLGALTPDFEVDIHGACKL